MMLSIVMFVSTIMATTGGMVIQSRWNHVRMKTIPPARVDGRRGGQVVLVCSATGSPTPDVAWYKDSLFVSHVDWSVSQETDSMGEAVARLVIPCLSQDDVGVYECRARAGHEEVTAVTQVNMEESDLPPSCSESNSIGMWRKTYLVEEGSTAVLTCRIQNSNLDYQVTWANLDGDLSRDDRSRYQIQPNGDLVIKDVSFADMGSYSCTATGSWGTDTVHTFMYPLAPERNSMNPTS